MGFQDAIGSIGIHTTVDNKPSNGTVDGVDSFDTKTMPSVDPGTQTAIGEADSSDKGRDYNHSNTHNIAGIFSGGISNYLTKTFANNSLNRQVFNPEEGKNLDLIG